MLMLIRTELFFCLFLGRISIHLMLMLIIYVWHMAVVGMYFNTSHVNVNLQIVLVITSDTVDFNTSHVNVNRTISNLKSFRLFISIHLMLMLILYRLFLLQTLYHFNTSHVNVNQAPET